MTKHKQYINSQRDCTKPDANTNHTTHHRSTHKGVIKQERNKNSHLLIGTMCRSIRILVTQQWLAQVENMLSDLSTSWDGLLVITRDLTVSP